MKVKVVKSQANKQKSNVYVEMAEGARQGGELLNYILLSEVASTHDSRHEETQQENRGILHMIPTMTVIARHHPKTTVVCVKTQKKPS